MTEPCGCGVYDIETGARYSPQASFHSCTDPAHVAAAAAAVQMVKFIRSIEGHDEPARRTTLCSEHECCLTDRRLQNRARAALRAATPKETK